jgi:hypothetical protein
METKASKEKNADMMLSYIDRLLKATHTKMNVVDTVMNVKNALKEAEKNSPRRLIQA